MNKKKTKVNAREKLINETIKNLEYYKKKVERHMGLKTYYIGKVRSELDYLKYLNKKTEDE